MTKLRVGLVGTSWWADAMYLPALLDHPDASITSICGRDKDRTQEIASRWNISTHTTDWRQVVEQSDAVIVASANDSHEEITLAALSAGRHVLCEKPLALDADGANRMVEAAARAGVTTMTPFTYRWMPAFAWVKELIDDGYIGRPHHLNLRYHTGYARNGSYAWRFDRELAGSGVLGDLGSHFLHVARWWCGEVSLVSALTDNIIDRDARPNGERYEQSEDSALVTLRFAKGGHGVVQVSAVAWEGDGFGQTHAAEIHGSEGTLHVYCDWRTRQEVTGLRHDSPGPAELLPIPEHIWNGARQDTLHNTYRDVFRNNDAMTRLWARSAAAGEMCQPDLAEGARVQLLVDAALRSAANNGAAESV
jgi:predicted dehydrogenase